MTGNALKSILAICAVALLLEGCVKTATYLECDRWKNSQIDLEILYSRTDLPAHKLSLDDLIEIALEKNLLLDLKALECSIQCEVATGSKFEMLPALILNAEENERNNTPGSSSQSLEPGVPPAPPSVSSKKRTTRWDTTLTWNLLDFGISFFRARQEANNVWIQQIEYSRLQQNLILDVTNQYWNAVTAYKGMESIEACIQELASFQLTLDEMEQKQFFSETRGLENRDYLVRMKQKYNVHQKDFHYAIAELGRLLGIPPSLEFELEYPEQMDVNIYLSEVEELESLALQNRPELYTYDVQEYVDIDEVHALALEMLPGISLFGGKNHNDNPFLIKNYWNLIGARVTWDLLSLPSQKSHLDIAYKQKELTKRNRLALSLATISQVRLSYNIYHDELENFVLAQEAQSVKVRLLENQIKREQAGRINGGDLVPYDLEAREAVISAWKAYGDLHFALEQLNNAMGTPRYYR